MAGPWLKLSWGPAQAGTRPPAPCPRKTPVGQAALRVPSAQVSVMSLSQTLRFRISSLTNTYALLKRKCRK